MSIDDRFVPVDLNLDRKRLLRIHWSDGVVGEIQLPALRRACPCAACRAQRDEQNRNPLAVLPAGATPAGATVVRDAELMGHYALRVSWEDGHDSGIYLFAQLRSLCELEQGE